MGLRKSNSASRWIDGQVWNKLTVVACTLVCSSFFIGVSNAIAQRHPTANGPSTAQREAAATQKAALQRQANTLRAYHNRNQYVTENTICVCPECRSRRYGIDLGITAIGGRPHVDYPAGCRDGYCKRQTAAGQASACGQQRRGFNGPLYGGGCEPICQDPYSFGSGRETSVHWPRPFSAFFDELFPGECCAHAGHPSGNATRHSCGNFFDGLNRLSNVKIVRCKVRTDNGYSGINCDPFGKLGLSQYPKVVSAKNPQTAFSHPNQYQRYADRRSRDGQAFQNAGHATQYTSSRPQIPAYARQANNSMYAPRRSRYDARHADYQSTVRRNNTAGAFPRYQPTPHRAPSRFYPANVSSRSQQKKPAQFRPFGF